MINELFAKILLFHQNLEGLARVYFPILEISFLIVLIYYMSRFFQKGNK